MNENGEEQFRNIVEKHVKEDEIVSYFRNKIMVFGTFCSVILSDKSNSNEIRRDLHETLKEYVSYFDELNNKFDSLTEKEKGVMLNVNKTLEQIKVFSETSPLDIDIPSLRLLIDSIIYSIKRNRSKELNS